MPEKNSARPSQRRTPLLIVISGPSGVGKDSVLNYLKKSLVNTRFVITLTTRDKRPKEKDGLDYHFVSRERFQKLLQQEELLESATVYNNYYGVPKQAVRDAFKEGNDAVVKVDVQGAANIKNIVPDAVFIFLAPPSLQELETRLTLRYTESPAQLATRLTAARNEMQQVTSFDYVVVNYDDELEVAVDEIKAIITAEKLRVNPRQISLA